MTDKTISVYWFFILFIVASAIAFLVYSLYGKPLDVRGAEGVFLAEKIADCVSEGGRLTSAGEKFVLVSPESNLMKECHLNFEVEEFKERWNDDQFFVSLTFTPEGGEDLPPITSGNSNLRTNSNLNFISSKSPQLPVCIKRILYSNGEGGKYYTITIFACVGKTEKNV